MSPDPWTDLRTALDDAPAPLRFWLRDDDAVAVTPALERLHAACRRASAPLLLAVIPAGVEAALGRWTADRPDVTPCQHGYAHRNHAEAGARACELGGTREDDVVLRELQLGRAAMDRAFGPQVWSPVLVPPWNRIRSSLVGRLPAAGYRGLSTFAGAAWPATPGLARLDCALDIIDWRHDRRGRDAADLAQRLGRLVRNARPTDEPIGILTHHLAHDADAWSGLEAILGLLAKHPAARLGPPGASAN